MEITIRKALSSDAKSIAELIQEIGWFPDFGENLSVSTIERVAQHIDLCTSDNSHTIYIAAKKEEIIGYVNVHWLPYMFLSGPEGFISEIFVKPNHRQNGVGKKLLSSVEAEAKERGCSRLMLVNSRERESYKRDFYTKVGWEERTQIANFVYKFNNKQA